MTGRDHSNEPPFFHPWMIEDLLRGFVPEEWVGRIGFSILERLSGSYGVRSAGAKTTSIGGCGRVTGG